MTEEDLKKFLDDNKAAILEAGKAAIIEKITEQMKWHLPDVVGNTVSTFLKDEIAPEVEKYLKDQKGAILQAVCTGASQIGDQLAQTMVKSAAEAMTSYRSREIFKALFNG